MDSFIIWKLFFAIVLNFILIIGLPYGLSHFDYMSPINDKAWIVLLITAFIVSIKTIFGDLVAGEFHYHKHGYDFCLTTLGASMTALSLQVITVQNLFPGVSHFVFTPYLVTFTDSDKAIAIAYLVLILIVSTFATFLTARISKAINHDSPRAPDLLALINFSIGTGLIGLYILLLITKGY